MSTLSANRTRDGLDLSLAFLAADSNADFRVDDWNRKSNQTKNLHALTLKKLSFPIRLQFAQDAGVPQGDLSWSNQIFLLLLCQNFDVSFNFQFFLITFCLCLLFSTTQFFKARAEASKEEQQLTFDKKAEIGAKITKVERKIPFCAKEWLTLSKGGWHTTKETVSRQFRTSCITWSLGALLTSSPLICRIWSPGRNLLTLGPPLVTNLKEKDKNILDSISLSGIFPRTFGLKSFFFSYLPCCEK